MIKNYVKGDIFKSPYQFIAHGCNNQGVMGGGVARIVRENIPYAYRKYHEAIMNDKLHLGEIQIVYTQGIHIVNMITQDFESKAGHRNVSYDAISECFYEMDKWFVKNKPFAPTEPHGLLAIPKIGAGLGGGNWDIIERIINDVTPNTEIVVYYIDDVP